MRYLLKNRLKGCGVGSQEVSQLGELGVLEESSEVADSHLSSSRLPAKTAKTTKSALRGGFLLNVFEAFWNAVEEVLNGPFLVLEGGSESSKALLSGESHVH